LCRELESRAGIWRFAPDRAGQQPGDGVRWATGIRNALAIAVDPRDDILYVVQHGRDQLGAHWPEFFDAQQNAEIPAEEFFRVRRDADYGWPYCYYDPLAGRKVLAPEYGGDGSEVGRCAEKEDPLLAFPAHWAPNGLLFYHGSHFPERYRGGAFIAFHGSWNRAPLPQAGYKVVFVPFGAEGPLGEYETFAGGFAGPLPEGGQLSSSEPEAKPAEHRPMALAQAPDGALFISDDAGGRIWRVIYTGR
ncbi:MAG: PQQ-dependent sugar dehydrogenase, partial [Gemmatimonadota bacterium]|nr:PQQ-dependent sugar dehydrogenase [Gemmatimonadota bacterium]